MSSVVTLVAAMVVLAVVPSVSALAVAARAASSGFWHGMLTAVGIVAGDLIYMLIAVVGLAAVAESFGGLFTLIQIAGGLYLIAIGVLTWRRRAEAVRADPVAGSSKWSWVSSFTTGLAITLADHKAILFYLAFFPAFVDLAALTTIDLGVIALITFVSICGAKAIYAALAVRSRLLLSAKVHRLVDRVAAAALIAVGVFVLIRPWVFTAAG